MNSTSDYISIALVGFSNLFLFIWGMSQSQKHELLHWVYEDTGRANDSTHRCERKRERVREGGCLASLQQWCSWCERGTVSILWLRFHVETPRREWKKEIQRWEGAMRCLLGNIFGFPPVFKNVFYCCNRRRYVLGLLSLSKAFALIIKLYLRWWLLKSEKGVVKYGK